MVVSVTTTSGEAKGIPIFYGGYMNEKYYEKLGKKIIEYVNFNKFTSTEIGQLFEQYYEILKYEEMRDLREAANKK
jgi:hypothetical protein